MSIIVTRFLELDCHYSRLTIEKWGLTNTEKRLGFDQKVMGFFRDENDGVSKFSKEIVSQLNIGKHTKKLWKITIFNRQINYEWTIFNS